MAKPDGCDVCPSGLETVMVAGPGVVSSDSEIAAVSCDAETNVVGSVFAFHRMAAPPTKFAPFTVSVKAGLPAWAVFGLSDRICGGGAVTLNAAAGETCPSGLAAVMVALPGAAMSRAGMLAVARELETKVVATGDPFHRIATLFCKFAPVTVRMKPAPPACADAGESALICGAGAVMANWAAAETCPPGLDTVMLADPKAAICAGVTAAASCVEERKVVARSAPFQRTADPETKFAPLTVRVNDAPPASVEEGLNDVICGAAGWLMENAAGAEVCWSGFDTVICAVPAFAIRLAAMLALRCVDDAGVVVSGVPFHRITAALSK